MPLQKLYENLLRENAQKTREITFKKTQGIVKSSSYKESQEDMEKYTFSSPFISNSVTENTCRVATLAATQVADGNMETYIIQQVK